MEKYHHHDTYILMKVTKDEITMHSSNANRCWKSTLEFHYVDFLVEDHIDPDFISIFKIPKFLL